MLWYFVILWSSDSMIKQITSALMPVSLVTSWLVLLHHKDKIVPALCWKCVILLFINLSVSESYCFICSVNRSGLQLLAKSVIWEIRIGLHTVKCYHTDTVVHLPTFWNMKSIPHFQIRASTADHWPGWAIPFGEETDILPKYLFFMWKL